VYLYNDLNLLCIQIIGVVRVQALKCSASEVLNAESHNTLRKPDIHSGSAQVIHSRNQKINRIGAQRLSDSGRRRRATGLVVKFAVDETEFMVLSFYDLFLEV